jgi:hypothetical protein
MVVADFGAMEIEATCRNRHTSDIEHLRGLVKVGEAARLTRPVLAALDEEGRRTSDLTDVQGLRGLSRNSVLERLQAMGEAVDSDDDDDSSPICATPFHTGEGAHERPTFRSRENSVDLLYEDKERRSTLVESIASTRSGSEYLSHTPPSASPTHESGEVSQCTAHVLFCQAGQGIQSTRSDSDQSSGTSGSAGGRTSSSSSPTWDFSLSISFSSLAFSACSFAILVSRAASPVHRPPPHAQQASAAVRLNLWNLRP